MSYEAELSAGIAAVRAAARVCRSVQQRLATAEALETPFLGEIPLDERIRLGGDNGIPIVVSNPDGPAAGSFRSIAEKVWEGLGSDK